MNPDVQARLVEEVDMFKDQLQGNLMTYETIHKMTYLDMVVNGKGNIISGFQVMKAYLP